MRALHLLEARRVEVSVTGSIVRREGGLGQCVRALRVTSFILLRNRTLLKTPTLSPLLTAIRHNETLIDSLSPAFKFCLCILFFSERIDCGSRPHSTACNGVKSHPWRHGIMPPCVDDVGPHFPTSLLFVSFQLDFLETLSLLWLILNP